MDEVARLQFMEGIESAKSRSCFCFKRTSPQLHYNQDQMLFKWAKSTLTICSLDYVRIYPYGLKVCNNTPCNL